MTARRTIFVVGRSGAGKTTLAEEVALRLSTTCINSGDALRAHLRRNNVSLSEVIDTGSLFIKVFGEAAIGAAVLRQLDDNSAQIVDGPRLFSTLTYFISVGRSVDVVHLQVDEEIRRERFRKRSILEGEATADNVDLLLSRKDAWDGELGQFADISRWHFENSGSLNALLTFADQIAFDLGRRGQDPPS